MKYKMLFLSALVFCLIAGDASAWGKKRSIQVRNGKLRSNPTYLSKVVTTLPYTTRVVILEKNGIWNKVQVTDTETQGWIHSSALTKKKLKMSADEEEGSLGVSSDEQALAGKGFNSDVEAEFKTRNKDIDFTWVDKMETFKVSPEEMQDFLKKGKVESVKGGVQ